MDKRTTAIIATVVTGLLCGCPGLAILCFGAFAIPTSFVPGAQIDVFGSNDPQSLLTSGIVGLCLGILLIAIPVAVGFTTLRNRPAPADMVVPPAPPKPVTPETPQPPMDFAPPAEPVEPEKPEPPADVWMGPPAESPEETSAEEPAEQPTAAQPPRRLHRQSHPSPKRTTRFHRRSKVLLFVER